MMVPVKRKLFPKYNAIPVRRILTMTRKRILRLAPALIAAALFLTAVVIILILPYDGTSDFVSEAARTVIHG